MLSLKTLNFFTRFIEKHITKPRFKKYASGSVAFYQNEIRVIAYANTNICSLNGWIVYFLPKEASNQEIGKKVVKALEEYINGLKYPTDPDEQKKLDKKIKKNMKINSWRNYAKEAKVVSFRWDGKQLEMSPNIKYKGFDASGGVHERIVDPDDHEAIGRTVRELWPLSK